MEVRVLSHSLIVHIGEKVLDGGDITWDEARALTQIEKVDIPLLLAMANKVREKFAGNEVETCEIINARSGACPEDCKFCAQSAHHDAEVAVYPLVSEEEIVAAARRAEEEGAHRFCIVTSGRGMEGDGDFPAILRAIKRIKRETSLEMCCSLGFLEEEHVVALKETGITRYHHNLETGKSFFPRICTTHSCEERLATIKRVKIAGLQVCSGGIIGMGENWEQRLEMAFALRELDVDSVPINILNPIKGTPLENETRLHPLEILQTFAIFRLILPAKIIRYAGGREVNLGDFVPQGLLSGINGMLIGNYLTTRGRGAAEDLRMIRDLGLEPVGPARRN